MHINNRSLDLLPTLVSIGCLFLQLPAAPSYELV